ncbi:NUDIX domain-containing protein [Streptomyces sp. NPDC087532]|uniref:NUDIX domain-containing protein n=1 Tax=Streptomyces sp. NPDC087532 TaxID=3365795 RepID=UPI0038302D8D
MVEPVTLTTIPTSVKAVVVHHSRVLLRKTRFEGEDCYYLPGGAQFLGETTGEALWRFVYGQTGVDIFPGRLLWLREYRGADGADDEHPVLEPGPHRIEMIFQCRAEGHVAGPHDEVAQTAEWVELEEVRTINLQPPTLRPLIAGFAFTDPAIGYLGDLAPHR